jgi:DNA-binding GntR family transcriptional regulator
VSIVKSPSRQLLSLPEQIAERIFSAIAAGEYAPGDRVREETLAEQFAVSRGPVREALRILERDSVVRIQPNRGAHVTQLSIKEVGDIFQIRGDLIGAVVRRLGDLEPGFLADIDAQVGGLENLAKDPAAAEDYLAASYALGVSLAGRSGNDRLAEILGSLARQTRRYSKLGLSTVARRRESVRTWRRMQTALAAGNTEAAAVAVERLVAATHQEAVRQLQAAEAGRLRPADLSQVNLAKAIP